MDIFNNWYYGTIAFILSLALLAAEVYWIHIKK